MNGLGGIEEKIRAFKKRYYFSLLLRGLLLTTGSVLGYYLLAALLEYFFWLSTSLRFLIVILFVFILLACGYVFLQQPLLYYLRSRGMTDDEAARYIGQMFPGIRDKLLNILQLSRMRNSMLAQAGLAQKARALEPLPFEECVDLRQNKRYLPHLLIPLGIMALLLLVNASVITRSTYRIVHFRQPFAPEAPFAFNLENTSLLAFRNEDFELKLALTGMALPEQVYLITGNGRYLMQRQDHGHFNFLFEKVHHPVTFWFEAAGFRSHMYQLKLAERPELQSLRIDLRYPGYTGRQPESLVNAGPLSVPQGTRVNFAARSSHASRATIQINNADWNNMQESDNQTFKYSSVLLQSGQYEIRLHNEYGSNSEMLRYPVEVIPDQYPEISVTPVPDSLFYKHLVTGGVVSDDYGITDLRLVFHMKKDGKDLPGKALHVPFNPGLPRQSFYYYWPLDTLRLKPGDELSYYLEVFDNDGVNGRKSTRSAVYTLRLPDKEQVQADIARSARQTLENLREGVDQSRNFKNELDELQQKLKGKQLLDWQEKKRLQDLVEKRKSLDQFLQQLSEQNKNLENKKAGFTEQDERLIEKARQLQKLMDELLDDETRKLLEELQRLLQENARNQDVQKLLEQLNRNARNLEKELERAYELMKRHQMEFQLEQTAKNLDELVQKQEQLLKETEETTRQKEDPATQTRELAEKQTDLEQKLEKIKEELQNIRKLGEETGETPDLPQESDIDETAEEMDKSRKNLEQNRPSDAREPQQKAIEKMKEMSRQMNQEIQGAMMEIDMKNLESLRHILHGLIKISHNQEEILTDMRSLPGNDPRFNELAQRQIKLKDDVKVLEDSLLALASRDPMMGSFVTREITDLDDNLQKAIEANNEKRRGPALNAMQLSMTSVNNLALMLDSHYDALMQMMANARPSRSRNNKGNARLSELQQQLNQKIEELKNSGRQGRELSEELARLAAEQERIRKALKEFEENLKRQGGKGVGDELQEQMEETEMDLVNKQLTDELIRRQRQILTRLLEAEKSAREQDVDEERKGETARDYDKIMPKAIEQYLKEKAKETELLRTLPPRLSPYYQREINEYLKRLRENQ